MITFDYGMKDRNPIDEVRFYQKNNPNKPMVFRKNEVCYFFYYYFDMKSTWMCCGSI